MKLYRVVLGINDRTLIICDSLEKAKHFVMNFYAPPTEVYICEHDLNVKIEDKQTAIWCFKHADEINEKYEMIKGNMYDWEQYFFWNEDKSGEICTYEYRD